MEGHGSTRREWLRLCAAAGASGMFVTGSDAPESLVAAVSAVDHLLLGVADLDRGIAWVETTTGVKAVIGGSHPGVGTRNALASLGGRRYLEIIAPDPAQKDFNFRTDVRKLSEPRLIAWAAGTSDIDAVAKKARTAGYQTFGPQGGSRARPDGKVLRWKTLRCDESTRSGRRRAGPVLHRVGGRLTAPFAGLAQRLRARGVRDRAPRSR